MITILTPQEFLEKENNGYNISEIASISMHMEKYSNYKNRILEDRIKELENKIVEFRFFLESEQTRNTTNSDALVNEEMNYLFNYLLPLYNKHFNIKQQTT